MTEQIQDIIDSMSEDSFYEDEAVILKTYIERIERALFITDQANAGLGRVAADLNNDKELLKKRIIKLTEPKTCKGCRYVGYFSPHESLECGNKDCNFYGCDVDVTDGCNKHEPKGSE